jgi:predicted transcriptional regulator
MDVKHGCLVGAPKYKIVGKLVGDIVEQTYVWFGENSKRNETGISSKLKEMFEDEYFYGKDNHHRIATKRIYRILTPKWSMCPSKL